MPDVTTIEDKQELHNVMTILNIVKEFLEWRMCMIMIKLKNLLSNAIFQEAKPKKAQINEFTGKIKPGLINFTMSQITSRK